MKFGATANPQQVAAMGHVIDAYCRHVGIDAGTPEERHVASLVLALYEAGIRGENDLLQALIVPTHRSADVH